MKKINLQADLQAFNVWLPILSTGGIICGATDRAFNPYAGYQCKGTLADNNMYELLSCFKHIFVLNLTGIYRWKLSFRL